MADRVKVYEEQTKKGLPIWAWLLPLLLLLAIIAYFLLRHHQPENTAVNPVPAAAAAPTNALPDLGVVHFQTDKATLTPEGEATLTRVAEAMRSNPNAHLRLEGYTDSTGGDQHNLTLSQQRTNTVAQFLKDKGIDGSRLTGAGFGPQAPVDTNATAHGKADNRRVELFSQQ